MKVLLVFVTLASLLGIALSSCSFPTKGKTYDFTSLGSFELTENDGNTPKFKYTYNFCKAFPGGGQCTGTQCATGYAFQYPATGSSCMNVGNNVSVAEITNGVAVTLINGQCNACQNGATFRTSVITILCDGSKDTHASALITEPSTCRYVTSFFHPSACGSSSGGGNGGKGSGGLSPGSIFLIVFFVTAVVYLVAGFVVNWKVRGASPGVEALPQYELWKEVPGLIVDGCKFTKAKIFGLLGRSSYTEL